MTQFIQPFFGDLVMKGAVVFAWVFVLFLLGDAWWQKRQARVMREQGGIPWPNRTNRRARPFVKKFRWTFVVLAVIPIMTLILVRGAENDSSGNNGLSAYATNFQGDATCPVPVARPANFNSNALNSIEPQASVQTNKVIVMYASLRSPQRRKLR